MAIVVAGTPGVGKTTVARRLAESLGAKYLNLAEVVVAEGLYIGYDADYASYVVDIERCRSYLDRVLSCREVVDTHVVEALPPRRVRLAVVLRLDPLRLKERLWKRGYKGRKLRENVEAEVLGLVSAEAAELFGRNRVCEVDVSSRSVEEVVELLLRLEKAGKVPKDYEVGSVDWLEKYHWILEAEDNFWLQP